MFLRRLALTRVACGVLLLATAGCATPRYRWPQGFSGTYHRAIFGDPRPQPPAEFDTAEVEPTEQSASGVFFPEELTLQRPTQRPTRYAILPPTALRQ